MKKLKSGDPIQVITGKYKGKVSSIEKIEEDNVWVKEVNMAKKAVKGKWFIKKHLPIHISNVMFYDQTSKAASRIHIQENKWGKKVRIVTKTKAEIK